MSLCNESFFFCPKLFVNTVLVLFAVLTVYPTVVSFPEYHINGNHTVFFFFGKGMSLLFILFYFFGKRKDLLIAASKGNTGDLPPK